MDLSAIFPTEDFRLKMRFTRGEPAHFFRRSDEAASVLAERKQRLAVESDVCMAMQDDAAPLLAEILELAAVWNTLPEGSSLAEVLTLCPLEQCRWLGERWETDFLLLKPDAEGVFRLCGGALCFPSHWDLQAKMGRTIAEIHGPVPGLNPALGRSIDRFMEKIRPNISWERYNWGLSSSSELNQHPSQEMKSLDESVGIHDVWWRLEDQSLIALPQSGGVLFGIRVTVHPLAQVKAHDTAREGLRQALLTMPEDMARYKGISRARERLCDLLAID